MFTKEKGEESWPKKTEKNPKKTLKDGLNLEEIVSYLYKYAHLFNFSPTCSSLWAQAQKNPRQLPAGHNKKTNCERIEKKIEVFISEVSTE